MPERSLTYSLKSLAKSLLKRSGYMVLSNDGMFGVDVWVDLKKLSQRMESPINVVFDVGANIGQTSVQALEMFPNAVVHAFEPSPSTYAALTQRVKNARFIPHAMALSNESSSDVPFFEYPGSGVLNSLVPNARYHERFHMTAVETSVANTTLDAFCSKNGIHNIDVLKIDTEGGDLRVLKGAEQMLASNRVRFLLFEFNDLTPREGAEGGSLNEIADYVVRFGFRFIATYTDYVVPDRDVFAVANCLMVSPKNGNT